MHGILIVCLVNLSHDNQDSAPTQSSNQDSAGVSSGSNSAGVPVQVKPVSNLQDIRQVMVRYCQQMTDEAQKQLNSLLLSDVTLEHILKIHRVITMSR